MTNLKTLAVVAALVGAAAPAFAQSQLVANAGSHPRPGGGPQPERDRGRQVQPRRIRRRPAARGRAR